MFNQSIDPKILIARLSHRPRHILNAMITEECPRNPPHATRADRACADRVSSLGKLDCLPTEIMLIILGMLQIQAIARFASLSFRGYSFVQSQYAYQDLVQLAPQALLALRKLGIINLHSITELHIALRTEKCSVCTEYGAFLFLPTCARCCWECLRNHPLLRVILPKEAKMYFGLSERHLKRLPTLEAITGSYDISAKPAPRHCRLVAVKAAKDMGLEVQGSAEKAAQSMSRRSRSTKQLVTGRYLQNNAAVSQTQDLLIVPSMGGIPDDNFFGMASIPFPSLSDSGSVENGLWCRGCEVTFFQYRIRRLPQDVLAALVPPNCEPQGVLLGLERRARSYESFLTHIRHCYGARQLAPDLLTNTD